jgi:hypothetical protein
VTCDRGEPSGDISFGGGLKGDNNEKSSQVHIYPIVIVYANEGVLLERSLQSLFETVKPSFHDKDSVFFTKLGAQETGAPK